MVDTRYGGYQEPGATEPYGFWRIVGGGGGDCGGHLAMHDDIHNTDCCAMLSSVICLMFGSLAEC